MQLTKTHIANLNNVPEPDKPQVKMLEWKEPKLTQLQRLRKSKGRR